MLMNILFAEITSFIMCGLHTFLPIIVRQQSVLNNDHEEMRGDSPQHAFLAWA